MDEAKGLTQVLQLIINYFKCLMGGAVVLVIVSSFYTIQSHEVGIVLRFGRVVGSTPAQQIRQPGLHFALPFFIDQVVRVPVHTLQERELTTHYSQGWVAPILSGGGYLLTGDQNVVLLQATIRYQITDAAAYALGHQDTGQLIEHVVSAALTEVVTPLTLDHVLTTGRGGLGQAVQTLAQTRLVELHAGVGLTSIELTLIVTPHEVSPYFAAVQSAAIALETTVQQAREQAQLIRLEAQAMATDHEQSAISQQTQRLTQTHQMIATFQGLSSQYQLNPQLIHSGVFRQRLVGVLNQSGQVIVVPEAPSTPVFLLP